MISSKHTPSTESIYKQRAERLTKDLDHLTDVKKMQYENVLDHKWFYLNIFPEYKLA